MMNSRVSAGSRCSPKVCSIFRHTSGTSPPQLAARPCITWTNVQRSGEASTLMTPPAGYCAACMLAKPPDWEWPARIGVASPASPVASWTRPTIRCMVCGSWSGESPGPGRSRFSTRRPGSIRPRWPRTSNRQRLTAHVDRGLGPSLTSRTSSPGCRFEREGLHSDLAVPHEKRIGPELVRVIGRLGDPPDVGNIALGHLLLQVERGAGLGELGKQVLKERRYLVHTAQHPGRHDHHRVRGVVRYDALQVEGSKTFQVVADDGLRRRGR